MARSKPGFIGEYVALRAFTGIVNLLPNPLALVLARTVAVVAFDVFRFKRRRTLARIRTVFPDLAEREVVRIGRGSLANMLMNGVEMMRSHRFSLRWLDRHVLGVDEALERLRPLVAEGHGVVAMVPHCGNWFMPGWTVAGHGIGVTALGSHQRNPYIEKWLRRHYGNVEVLDRNRRDTLMTIRDRLAAGRVFAIMPDLRVHKRDVEVEFLGGSANVSRAGAMFALRAGAPIMLFCMSREGFRHRLRLLAILRPDPNADRRSEATRLMRESMRHLDAAVRERPQEWYWFNKRWILEPPDDPAPAVKG